MADFNASGSSSVSGVGVTAWQGIAAASGTTGGAVVGRVAGVGAGVAAGIADVSGRAGVKGLASGVAVASAEGVPAGIGSAAGVATASGLLSAVVAASGGLSTADAFTNVAIGAAAGVSTVTAASTIAVSQPASASGIASAQAVAGEGYEGAAAETDITIAVHVAAIVQAGEATATVATGGSWTSSGLASSTVDLLATHKAVGSAAGESAVAGDATVEEILESSGVAADEHTAKIVATEVSTGDASSTLVGERFTKARAASTGTSVVSGVGLGPLVTTGSADGVAAAAATGLAALPAVGNADGASAVSGLATAVFEAIAASSGAAIATATAAGKQVETLEDVAEAIDLIVFAIPSVYPILWNNSQLGAGATWEGLPFNSMVEADGVIYAAGVGGMYQLVDGDDNGAAIESEMQWDLKELNASDYQTRQRSLYVSAVADAPFTVRISNKQGEFVSSTHLPFSHKLVNHRAPIGRGVSSRAARVSLLQNSRYSASDAAIVAGDTTRRV